MSHRLNFEGAFRSVSPLATSNASSAFTPNPAFNLSSSYDNRRTLNSPRTPDREPNQSQSSAKLRKTDSMSSIEDYRELFVESLSKQTENNELYHEVLALKKTKAEYAIEMSKVDLSKKQFELETARALAKIELMKQQKLADLEIKKLEKQLEN